MSCFLGGSAGTGYKPCSQGSKPAPSALHCSCTAGMLEKDHLHFCLDENRQGFTLKDAAGLLSLVTLYLEFSETLEPWARVLLPFLGDAGKGSGSAHGSPHWQHSLQNEGNSHQKGRT